MPTEPILAETIAGIRRTLGAELDRIVIERAVIGLFFTGVKLASGVAGACATPLRSIPEAVCCPSSAMAMPFPGKLRGRLARDLLKETEARSGVRRGVVLGGVRVTAPAAFLNVLEEGGSGYHFFGRSAEKVVLVRKTRMVAACAA
jgi:hypothetical protein